MFERVRKGKHAGGAKPNAKRRVFSFVVAAVVALSLCPILAQAGESDGGGSLLLISSAA